MRRRYIAGLIAALASLLAIAPAASARDATITSFDGTKIVLSFFPAEGLEAGSKAPTVLFGPGWSQGRDTDENSASEELFGSIGVGALRRAGYNVLTWDPRGFGQSGGTVTVDAPDREGRDVQALFDFVAKQPEALLDAPGDARLGMTGASYGGGIQLVVAGIDDRLDAIVPGIAWHSLGTSLYKDDTFKGGWGNTLFAAGVGGGRGRLDPHITSAYASGQATGRISAEDKAWFLSRGPGDLVRRIRIPTLFTQGTADTLFTLREAITNYEILRRNGVPTKMLWFCGGHGACLSGKGQAGRIEKVALNWLARYLKRDRSVKTGPRFDWIDQEGATYTQSDYPLASIAPITAGGSGTLALSPGQTSGGAIAATRAPGAFDLAVPALKARTFIVGEPKVRLTYSGTAANPDTRVYAQVVENATGRVAGNMVTPIPLILDGKTRTVSRALEPISLTLPAGSGLTLQIAPGTSVYDVQRSTGAVSFSNVRFELPAVDPKRTPPGYPASARRSRLKIVGMRYLRKRRGRQRVAVRVRPVGGTARNVRAAVKRKRRVMGRSRARTIKRTKRYVVRLRKGAGRRRYAIVVAGRRPDGSRVRAVKRIPRRALSP